MAGPLGNKLSGFGQRLLSPRQEDNPANEMPSLIDARAEAVVFDFVYRWIRTRIMLSRQAGSNVSSDSAYRAAIEYFTTITEELMAPRMWTGTNITDNVWGPIERSPELFNFIYKGTSLLMARVMADSINNEPVVSRRMCAHIAESLTCMSDTKSTIIPQEQQAVLPRYDELVNTLSANPWLMFVYYLSRIDIYDLITYTGENNEPGQPS